MALGLQENAGKRGGKWEENALHLSLGFVLVFSAWASAGGN